MTKHGTKDQLWQQKYQVFAGVTSHDRLTDRQTDRIRSSAMRPIINNWHAADFGQRFIL